MTLIATPLLPRVGWEGRALCGPVEPDQPSRQGCLERVEVLLPQGGHRRTSLSVNSLREGTGCREGSSRAWVLPVLEPVKKPTSLAGQERGCRWVCLPVPSSQGPGEAGSVSLSMGPFRGTAGHCGPGHSRGGARGKPIVGKELTAPRKTVSRASPRGWGATRGRGAAASCMVAAATGSLHLPAKVHGRLPPWATHLRDHGSPLWPLSERSEVPASPRAC